ncbi:MAG: hypothetical protein SGCHY_004796 [Lobulomycetales sp.]
MGNLRQKATALWNQHALAHVSTYIFIFLLLAVNLVVFHLLPEPLKVGFRLDDPSLSHRINSVDNVPVGIIYIFVGVLPVTVVLVTCLAVHLFGKGAAAAAESTHLSNHVQIYLQATVMAIMYTNLVNMPLKLLGRLRPDWLQRCFVEFPHIPTANSTLLAALNENYECTNPDKSVVLRGRTSFPSGHSSIAFSGIIVFVLWIQIQLPLLLSRIDYTPSWYLRVNCGGARILLVMLPLSFGCYTAASRVILNQHHVSDVLAGAALGIAIGSYLYFASFPPLERPPPSRCADIDHGSV